MDRRQAGWVAAAAGAIALLILFFVGGGEDPRPEPTVTGVPTSPTPTVTASPAPAATPSPPPSPVVEPSPTAPAGPVTPVVSDVVTGLEVPWGLAFTADGTAYVSERDTGRILEVPSGGDVREVARLPIDPAGEGGLLGLAIHPEGIEAGLYAYRTTSQDNRVVRLRLPDPEPDPVLTGIPAPRIHEGGRIAFGPDGMLYVATGDGGEGERAQDLGSLSGKILRLTPDGQVPADNPFDGSPVFSLGHRNVQGLAWDAAGQLYATEFGPDRDDEVNRIEAGANYGWPVVTGRADREQFVDPIYVRQPAEASWSGATILSGSRFPAWDGDMLAASLRGERLWRLPLDGGSPEDLLVDEYGRLRLAAQAPDGSVWLLTSNRDGRGSPRQGDDRIMRLAPAG